MRILYDPFSLRRSYLALWCCHKYSAICRLYTHTDREKHSFLSACYTHNVAMNYSLWVLHRNLIIEQNVFPATSDTQEPTDSSSCDASAWPWNYNFAYAIEHDDEIWCISKDFCLVHLDYKWLLSIRKHTFAFAHERKSCCGSLGWLDARTLSIPSGVRP